MSVIYKNLARPALFALNAETAHGISIQALRSGLHPRARGDTHSCLKQTIAGLEFPNPLGMAAGYDKNAEVPGALLGLGFGHVEIGTVTPNPQPGNPKPRIFRLIEDRAVINRLGFNSAGHATARGNLSGRDRARGIVGVNLGANKTSEDFGTDYVSGIAAFASLADYFTINISSPNTPGLRALQGADPLADLLERVSEARAQQDEHRGKVPLFLKIAPDLTELQMDAIASAVANSDFDALIVSNTTLSRSGLNSPSRDEVGGLSGRPLFDRSTKVLAHMHQRLRNGHNCPIPLIGVGGVHDGHTAFQKLEAGASLVQLYSALVYEGPGLPAAIINDLAAQLERENISSVSNIIGRKAQDWATKRLSE